MPKLKVEDLNDMAREGKLVDDSLFIEQRSNIRLYRGDHYAKTANNIGDLSQIRRRDKANGKRNKLRITINFIHKACNIYSNFIANIAPSVDIAPANPSETSDMKVAEMHQKIWSHIKEINDMSTLNRKFTDDFTIIGEALVKVFWNPAKGIKVPGAIKQDFNAETGEPVSEPYQEMVMSGDVDYESLFGFNLRRDPSATVWNKCRWVQHDKMVDKKEVEAQFKIKLKDGDSVDETFKIFDTNSASYFEMTNKYKKVLVRETYFRPCLKYPEGYYYISTDYEILAKGKLPLGEFPIKHAFFDEVPGSPRGYSIIKQARSSQAEINRAVSKTAEHQITLGDDTVYIQKGTKVSPGGYLNGIKAVQYSGIEPKIVQGRDGSQYSAHYDKATENFFRILDISEFIEKGGTQDLTAQLYKNLREREKFTKYAAKMEKFQKDICKMSLKFYKHFAPDALVLEIIGADEQMNLPEFRKSTELSYQIRLDEVTEDVDTKFARMQKFTEILQFSPDLPPEVRGLIIKNMPYANIDELSKEITRDYEYAQNVILALDRGEQVPVRPRENHIYMTGVLSSRTMEGDFKYKPPQIQQMYEQRIEEHEIMETERVKREQELTAGFIPSGGDLVSVNMTISVPNADGTGTKTERLKLPVETINWVKEMLAKQGWSQEQLSKLLPESRAEMGDMMSQRNGPLQ